MSYTWTPRVGSLVELHYDRRRRRWIGRHLQVGVVRRAPGPGRGPRNYLIECEDGDRLIVPNGQIFPLATEPKARQCSLF